MWLTGVAGASFSGAPNMGCVSGDYYMFNVTPTIQTLSKRVKNNLYNRVLRGKIEKYYVYGRYVLGYLSTRYFVDDHLIGFSEPEDLEGFFIFDAEEEELLSGMSDNEYDELVNKMLGLRSARIKYIFIPSDNLETDNFQIPLENCARPGKTK